MRKTFKDEHYPTPMAKRRIEPDEEEKTLDFKIPKFDEESFIRKEKVKIKTTFISFCFGFLVAIISFGFWALLSGSPFQWTLVLLFGLFSTAWLNYIFRKLNINLDDLGKKGLFISYAIHIFTWIFVLIVLVNPPFYDGEVPMIDAVTLPNMQEPGGTVKIVAHVADNSGIADNKVDFILRYNDTIIKQDTYILENGIFLFEFENPENISGTFSYNINTTDTRGYTKSHNGTFFYGSDVIKVPEPAGSNNPPGPSIRYTTDVKIDIKPNVDWVYYTVDDHYVNVTKDAGDLYYTSTPRIQGWTKNSQAIVKVYAHVYHYFENVPTGFNNTIVDTETYYFNVSDDAEIGTEISPTVILPQPRYVYVPGFETVLFVLSLIGVVFIIKHSKKHRRP
jgi:hypothetical protein